MMLSDKTSEALDILVGACFDLNRTTDRMCSWMNNVWSMPQATDIIHHKLAHLWPLMADIISGFKDQYNLTTYYPETHGDKRKLTEIISQTIQLRDKAEQMPTDYDKFDFHIKDWGIVGVELD